MPEPLFDHFVGAYQQPGRKFDPERLRRFEVEGQLDFYGLLDRQIGWFLALVWGSRSQALFHGILHFLHTSFFVRLEIPFLRPDPHVLEAGARRGCQGRPSLYAPHAPSFPGRALIDPSTAARSVWSG